MVGSRVYIHKCYSKSSIPSTMDEDSNVVDHMNHISLVAKDLSAADNHIPNKMQVSTILSSLPPSWTRLLLC